MQWMTLVMRTSLLSSLATDHIGNKGVARVEARKLLLEVVCVLMPFGFGQTE